MYKMKMFIDLKHVILKRYITGIALIERINNIAIPRLCTPVSVMFIILLRCSFFLMGIGFPFHLSNKSF